MSRWAYDSKLQRFVSKPASGAVAVGDVGPISQDRILGRVSSGSGAAEELTAGQVKTLLDIVGVTAAVLAAKAPLAAPALTGAATAETPTAGDNSTRISTTAFVQAAIAALVNSSPAALDTLNELAAALGNDPNFATTMANALAYKQPLSVLLTAIDALTPTSGYVLTGTGTSFTMSAPAGGGGLTNFTESVNSSAPNATVPVVSLSATNASANVDVSFRTKGAGAILANVPDATLIGGDKRGQYAVDLQLSRSSATKVAAGNYSAILSGYSNQLDSSQVYSVACGGSSNTLLSNNNGGYSALVGGLSNSLDCQYGFIGAGRSNQISADYAVLGGGQTNIVATKWSFLGGGFQNSNNGSVSYGYNVLTGGRANLISDHSYQTIGGGYSNQIAGDSDNVGANTIGGGISNRTNGNYGSCIPGGLYAKTNFHGEFAFGSRNNAATIGGNQLSIAVLWCDTAGSSSAITMTTGSSYVQAKRQIDLEANSALAFTAIIVAKRQATSTQTAAWKAEGLIMKGATNSATTLVYSLVTAISNAPAWPGVTISADTTYGALKFQFQGAFSSLISVTATVFMSKVVY